MFQLPALTVPMGSTALQAAIAAPWDSSTVVVVTSLNKLAAARPHSAGHVEAPDPDIIMRRLATSERTMTPAQASMRSR